MYDKLAEMLEQGHYEDALAELGQIDIDDYTEELAILAVSTLLALGEYETAREYLQLGLKLNPRNAELYLLLGNYYESRNRLQAYFCYENAELYCTDPQDQAVIQSFKENLASEGDLNYRKVAIVILSYNTYEMTRFCIESIRRNNVPSSYEIIVVDNASTDESLGWLERQQDVVLVKNSENRGFPCGCNQGIRAAGPDSDILLLNSDTILFPNSLFWLRMGLYEQENIGSAGCMTNHSSNGQVIREKFASIQEYEQYALKNNVLQDKPYELKPYLVGFAVLVRREAMEKVGELDIRYSPGQFEGCDLGIRLCCGGYRNILCHNSFIYHFGGGAGQNRQFWQEQYKRNRVLFKEKWGFDISYYSHVRDGIADLLDCGEGREVNVLEVGCGLGATLARIQFMYPYAHVYGMELMPEVASVGGRILDIVQGDIENSAFPFDGIQFDYIIFADVLEHLHEPERIVREMAERLKKGGAFICSIPNIMNLSVLYPLLQGKFEYEEAGILDRTHLKFFTLDSIGRLFAQCGFHMEKLLYSQNADKMGEQEMECLQHILNIPGCADRDQFLAYQYLFLARAETQ